MNELTLTFCPVVLVPGREILLHCRVHDRLHLHLSTLPHPGENASGWSLQFGGPSGRHCHLPARSHQALLDARAFGHHGVCRFKILIVLATEPFLAKHTNIHTIAYYYILT